MRFIEILIIHYYYSRNLKPFEQPANEQIYIF